MLTTTRCHGLTISKYHLSLFTCDLVFTVQGWPIYFVIMKTLSCHAVTNENYWFAGTLLCKSEDMCCVNLKIDRKLISKVVTSCIDNPAEKMIALGIIWLESTDCDGVGIGWVVGKQHWSNISNLPGPGWCFVCVFLVHNLSNNL